MKGGDKMAHHENSYKEGFSLIEMVIAIAVLAVLSLPVIAFFTNAHVFTEKGMTEQRANIAAQSVMEEFNQFTSFEQIEQLGVVTPNPKEYHVVKNEAMQSMLQKDFTFDGLEYTTNVTIDYDPYKDKHTFEDGSTTKSVFNAYEMPQLKEVFSPESVVFEETDELEIAVNDIYSSINSTSVTKDTIRASMVRNVNIDIKTDASDPNFVIVRGNLIYSFANGGKTYSHNARLDVVKKQKTSLKRIYMFYKPLRNDILAETGDFTCSSDLNTENFAKNLSIYYLVQDSATLKSAANYTLTISDLNNVGATYYTNKSLITTGKTVNNKLLEHSADSKRIAKITVKIYHKGEEIKEENCLATVESAKSE